MNPQSTTVRALVLAGLLNALGCVSSPGSRSERAHDLSQATQKSTITVPPETPSKTTIVEAPALSALPFGPRVPASASPFHSTTMANTEILLTGATELAVDPPQELTLQEAIDMTLAANPDLQSAVERSQYAEEVLARARADFFPVLSLSQSYEISDNDLRKFSFLLAQGQINSPQLFNPPDTVDNYHTQLHLQHDLYNGGLRLARKRSAEAEREAAHCSLSSVRNRLAYQVAEAYYRLFQARELVKVREESVRQVEKQLESVQARFRAQTATQSDVLQVETRRAQEREGLITAGNKLKLAWAVLENVTATPLPCRVLPATLPLAPWTAHVEQLLASLPQEPADPEEGRLAAEATAYRSEVGEINSRLQSAQHLVRAAEAGKYPVLSFVGDYDIFSQDLRNQTTDGTFYAGVVLSINLFDGGRTKANVRQAQARVRELSAQERRVRLDIALEVRQAHLQYVDAVERLKMARVAVTSAGEALRLVESRYTNQNATVPDLLGAQVALSEAQVRVTNATAEIEVARAAIERSLGRLRDLLNPPEHSNPHDLPLAPMPSILGQTKEPPAAEKK